MTMTEAVLAKHLGRLQLPYFVQHAPDLMTQAARESWSHGRFLEGLVAGEVARRDEALIARRIQAARLPGIKTLDGFDWSWPKKINRAQIQHLFRLDFVPPHGNVILLGAVGVGKTHLASAGQRLVNGRHCRDVQWDENEVPQTIRHGGSLPCHAFPVRGFLTLLRRHDPAAFRLLMTPMVPDMRWRIPCRHRATSVASPTRLFRNIRASSDA
jgi:hypothetical protein